LIRVNLRGICSLASGLALTRTEALQLLAGAGDLQPMRFDGEAQFVRHFAFELLDLSAVELDDFLAIFANDVIVMRMFGVIGIVKFMVLAEIHFMHKTALGEQGQGAIDGRARNGFVPLARPVQKLFGRKMFFGAENGIDDGPALRSEPQTFRLQEIGESLFGSRFGVVSHEGDSIEAQLEAFKSSCVNYGVAFD
jgi:hypothetical protein